MDYDKTDIPEAYARARDHGPAFLDQWMKIVSARVHPSVVRDILDLGCGTGRFSNGLSACFNANLIGIDPSRKMLEQAEKIRSSARVYYANGLAEAIPLSSGSVDLVFISMVFHHFTDPHVVAQECRRVLRTHGRLCLRTACSDQIPGYAYVPFFPETHRILEERLPSLVFQREVFESASFKTLSYEVITQEVASDYSAYADKLALKADSILASLDDEIFEAGLERLRTAALTAFPQPITEPIDFLVFEPN